MTARGLRCGGREPALRLYSCIVIGRARIIRPLVPLLEGFESVGLRPPRLRTYGATVALHAAAASVPHSVAGPIRAAAVRRRTSRHMIRRRSTVP